MTYTQADYQTVLELVTPTPERVATAKAWIAEHRSDHAQWGPEGAESEFAVSQGELDPAQINSRDPANQDQMIRWTQWAGAFRSAISEFERAGLLVPVFQSTPDSPAQSGWGFFTRSVGVPLGSPGENVTPSPLPLPLIYAMYAWSPLTETEKKRRLELYDADLYMVKANLQKFEERAQRCVSEALACYRSDLFLASADMLGAASEAAWHELAEAMVADGLGKAQLQAELARPSPSIAQIQKLAIEDLRRLSPSDFLARFGLQRSIVDSLGDIARYWRDVRNYGMHPAGAVAPETFSESSVGVQLMGATAYFEKLSSILAGLT